MQVQNLREIWKEKTKNQVNMVQTKASVEFLWRYPVIYGREQASTAQELLFLLQATVPRGKGPPHS